MPHKTTWNSRLGFILASAGSAVGLGAIWKFPYMAGANGGAPFLFTSLLFGFTLGFGLLLTEFSVGRAGRSDPIDAVKRVCGPLWQGFAILAILTGFLILCFYSTVAGWCLKYLVDSVLFVHPAPNAEGLSQYFSLFTQNAFESIGFQYAFLAINALVLCFGVNRGIERVAKVLMPLFFIMILILIARGLTLPGAQAGLDYLLNPNFENFTVSSVLSAMGYTFFSLSLGSGAMISYGSYLSDKANLMTSTAWIIILALGASLLGGLMILPTVFAFGLDPTAGPGLTFVTMPAIFSQLPAGDFFAIVFYLCLVFAALTSSISMAEASILYFNRRLGMKRIPAVLIVTGMAALIGAFCTLSFGALSDPVLAGKNFFDLLDYTTSNIGMSVSAFGVALGACWAGWDKVKPQLISSGLHSATWLATLRVFMGAACPLLIIVIVLTGI